MKNKSKGLFWYGFRARMFKALGVICFIFSMPLMLILNVYAGFGVMGFGIFLVIIGARNLYDYKRQGGYIVYDD